MTLCLWNRKERSTFIDNNSYNNTKKNTNLELIL